jgi:predicted glycogen debranching enzyme
MIYLNKDICDNLDIAVKKEWLETNGIGGYASSTIIGMNTRGYHGLLIAATHPPLGRMLLLSKVEETIAIGNEKYEISCNQYPDTVYPKGYEYLYSFTLDPFPVFTYILGNFVIKKSIFMVHGENTTVISYKLLDSPSAIIMELRPLVAFRDFHARVHEGSGFNMNVICEDNLMRATSGGINLFLSANVNSSDGARQAEFRETGYWYRKFEYQMETYRGQENHEDLYNPGYFAFKLRKDEEAILLASTNTPRELDTESLRDNEINRRKASTNIQTEYNEIKSLSTAADQFVVKRDNLFSIIAGYHWFRDWSRDTMIDF